MMKMKVITVLKWIGTIIGMIAGVAIFWYNVIELTYTFIKVGSIKCLMLPTD